MIIFDGQQRPLQVKSEIILWNNNETKPFLTELNITQTFVIIYLVKIRFILVRFYLFLVLKWRFNL